MRYAAHSFDPRVVRILCVDADPAGRRALLRIIGHSGHATHVAGSVGEALDVLRHDQIDVVITRHPVPLHRGIELTRLLRAEGITTPVLALSGDSAWGDGVQVSDDVAGEYIVQPVGLPALEHAIHAVLDNRRPSVLDHERAIAQPSRVSAAQPADRVSVTLDTLNVAEAERRLITEALTRSGNNRAAAAGLLGMHVRTLRRKLKSMRLHTAALPDNVLLEEQP